MAHTNFEFYKDRPDPSLEGPRGVEPSKIKQGIPQREVSPLGDSSPPEGPSKAPEPRTHTAGCCESPLKSFGFDFQHPEPDIFDFSVPPKNLWEKVGGFAQTFSGMFWKAKGRVDSQYR